MVDAHTHILCLRRQDEAHTRFESKAVGAHQKEDAAACYGKKERPHMEIVVPSSAPCLRGGRRDTNILRIQSEYHLLIWSSGDVESSLITHFFLCSVSPIGQFSMLPFSMLRPAAGKTHHRLITYLKSDDENKTTKPKLQIKHHGPQSCATAVFLNTRQKALCWGHGRIK